RFHRDPASPKTTQGTASQTIAEYPIRRCQRKVGVIETLERFRAQTLAHRISNDKCADEGRAADGCAENDANMRARMKSQAPPDERPESHRSPSGSGTAPRSFVTGLWRGGHSSQNFVVTIPVSHP